MVKKNFNGWGFWFGDDEEDINEVEPLSENLEEE